MFVNASRYKNKDVTNQRKYPATIKLMIALTYHVGFDNNRNVLEKYRSLFSICLTLKLDKHIFKIESGHPSNNHKCFSKSIDEKMFNTRKLKEYHKDRIKFGLAN